MKQLPKLFTVFLIIFFISCSLEKKAGKNFDKAYRQSEKIVEQRLNKLFPPKPPIIVPGKTIIIDNKDSIEYYRKQADSIRSLKPKIIRLQDSCGKEANDSYTIGFNTGLEVGKYEAKIKCPPSTMRVDTFIVHSSEDSVNNAAKSRSVNDLTTQNIQLRTELKVSKKENWFHRFAWILLVIGGIAGFIIKKKIPKI